MDEIKIEIGDTEITLDIKEGKVYGIMVSTLGYLEDILVRGKSFARTELNREPNK